MWLQILEVVLVLFFLYIFLSILLTAVNEFVDCFTGRRVNVVRTFIYEIFSDMSEDFWEHPLIQSINCSEERGNANKYNTCKLKPRYSDISNEIIADVMIDLAFQCDTKGGKYRCQLKNLDSSLKKIMCIHTRNAQWKSKKVKERGYKLVIRCLETIHPEV